LVQARSDQRRVRIGYCSEAGTEWVTEVDPWAIVVRHGRWYLLCHSHAADARRAYRVDRVRTVEVLAETFALPPGLDPVAELEDHLAVGWEYRCEVLVDAPLDRLVSCVPRSLGRLAAEGEERTRLVGTTSNPYWYAEQLAALPAPFQVLGGPELRHTTRALGERLLAASEPPLS
jgi:predicted DNA-binding transcriptional regulator YafY